MADYQERIFDLSLKGYCCSQILIQLGLDLQEEENPDMINAVKALCGGLYSGLLCGALSGGACLLSYLEPEKASEVMIPELVEWFKDRFETVNCQDIIGDNPMAKVEKCPNIVKDTYEKVLELLDEY